MPAYARAPVWLSSAGFALAGLSTGALIGRCGVRIALAAFLVAYPGPSPAAPAPGAALPVPGRVLSAALRDRGVQLGVAMLALYVGAAAVRDSAGPGPPRRLAANHRADLTR
jgi:hypothetical protein